MSTVSSAPRHDPITRPQRCADGSAERERERRHVRAEAHAHRVAPEQLTALLPEQEWEIEVAEGQTREVTNADQDAITITDTVVRALRR